MAVNWRQGFARIAVAARWVYVALALFVLANNFIDVMKVWHSEIGQYGSDVWEWSQLGQAIGTTIGWGLAWFAVYLALKFLLRGMRWVVAGFLSPQP